MYVPAQPTPANARQARADQKPSANAPKATCAIVVQPTPKR
jgi:hypothetical protein